MDEITLISNFEHNILGDWLYIEFRIQRKTVKVVTNLLHFILQ